MFYVYILQSIKFGTYYVGITANIDNRINLHNHGRVRSTKAKKPWKILCAKQVSSLSEARKLELRLKLIKKRIILENIIKHF